MRVLNRSPSEEADEKQDVGRPSASTNLQARLSRVVAALVGKCSGNRKATTSSSQKEQEVLGFLQMVATAPLEVALAQVESTGEPLAEDEAARLLKTHGPNELKSARSPSWYSLLLQGLINPFNALLATLSTIAIATGDHSTFAILMVMVILSTGIRFYQELQSEEKISALKMMITNNCEVERTSKEDHEHQSACRRTISRRDLVVGDVVCISTGSLLPADCLVLEAEMLTVSQSTLTGESIPIHKHAVRNDAQEKSSKIDLGTEKTISSDALPTSVFEMPNLLFMGSYVVSGHAKALVLRRANESYIGQVASALERSRPTTTFQRGIRQVSIMLMTFMVVMVPLVLVVEGLVSHDWKAAGLFCLSVAVGLVPEMLPMVVNTNLARGAIVMAKRKVIAKQLDAIQNLGAVNVLCSDKTGTLTSDKMSLDISLDPSGKVDLRPQRLAYYNAVLVQGYENPIDHAIITAHEMVQDREDDVKEDRSQQDEKIALPKKIGEIPFDFQRRLVSVIYEEEVVEEAREKGDQTCQDLSSNQTPIIRRQLVCKGALEEVLRRCTTARNSAEPLDITACMALGEVEAAKGKRVLGVATCVIDEEDSTCTNTYTVAHEHNMTFEGFLAFLDPPKEDAAESLAELMRLGLEVKVVTGDALATATTICGTLGIINTHPHSKESGNVGNRPAESISGPELSMLGPLAFEEAVSRCKVFAKVTPLQKLEIVESLRRQGCCVAFLGDGINDAPALRAADCGISVNTGSDVAKDAASIVLLEKSLHVVIEGVRVGRVSSMNTLKYIKMAASSNFGNVFSLLYASAWLPFTPMTPTQLLTQNLAYDLSQSSIPWDTVDEEMVAQPCQWSTRRIALFMVCIGPLSSLFDFATFASNWWLYGINASATPAQIQLFQTHWFLEGLLTQTLIIHVLRTGRIPFVQSRASWVVSLTTSIIALVGIAIPYTPLGTALHMQRPEPSFYGILAACLLSYVLLVQAAKHAYIKVFKHWL